MLCGVTRHRWAKYKNNMFRLAWIKQLYHFNKINSESIIRLCFAQDMQQSRRQIVTTYLTDCIVGQPVQTLLNYEHIEIFPYKYIW